MLSVTVSPPVISNADLWPGKSLHISQVKLSVLPSTCRYTAAQNKPPPAMQHTAALTTGGFSEKAKNDGMLPKHLSS